MKAKAFLALAALLVLLQPSTALYMLLSPGDKRCFIVEVPVNTLVVGSYKAPDLQATGEPGANGNRRQGLRITGVDPQSRQPFFDHITLPEGRFAFTSKVGGEHEFCAMAPVGGWFGRKASMMRFHLNFKTGAEAMDFDSMDHLSEIEVEVRRLIETAKDVAAELKYQEELETEFQAAGARTNRSIVLWAALQTLVLVSTAYLQLQHLKRFFRAKKLV
eukprot:tig00021531_g22169.t1